MKLDSPIMISARLLPAVKIADCTLSIEPIERRENRIYWRYHFDRPGKKSHSADDLSTSGGFSLRAEGDYREAISTIVSFLSAAVESRESRERSGGRYDRNNDTNENLFPPFIVRYFSEHSSELDTVSIELEDEELSIEPKTDSHN